MGHIKKYWKHYAGGYVVIGGAYAGYLYFTKAPHAPTDAMSFAKTIALWPGVVLGAV